MTAGRLTVLAVVLWFSFASATGADEPPSTTLGPALAAEDPAALGRDVRKKGDPTRGARLFFQGYLGCAKCHTPGVDGVAIGPDLSRDARGRTDVELIESVLDPSKVVRKGYETVTVSTRDGKTFTGVLAEDRPDSLLVRDPARDGRTLVIPKADIEDRRDGGPSLMPAGLANTLGAREEFLDLMRYVFEVAERGVSRALELKPTAAELAPLPLPPYESDLDHAGMIAGLDAECLKRGEAIYERVCASCHGTKDRPGSLPTSLRFASGAFKNGADPYRMYRTLTGGFGQMAPQTWMMPQQKYDVVHFIREAYLKPYNPTQYVAVTGDYLASLPKGTARGPKAVESDPWARTDYGPSLMLTVELGDDQETPNLAYKGIAVRLDPGPGGVSKGRRFAAYDHDTLRLAGAWSGRGFIDWRGINFTGQHEVHPHAVGSVVTMSPVGPGWADPATGTFDEPRERGRDGRPYGPLPRAWAHYKGLYHHGPRVVLSYSVGDADVLESPGAVDGPDGGVVVTRALNVGKSTRDLALRVTTAGTAASVAGDARCKVVEAQGSLDLHIPASVTPVALSVLTSSGTQKALDDFARTLGPPEDLKPLTTGGPKRWPAVFVTRPTLGGEGGPYAADVLTPPVDNPWDCQFRLGGLDFFEGGRRAAVCSWDGDVWTVDGVDSVSGPLTWRRIASGLFQPLGLKIVGGRIYVSCRDQIVILRDLNGDGETDFYENFNSDHQVTEHFHEFAMDLQTDDEGNFYYAKAARHAKTALVPQHGTLLKVAKDGSSTEIIARGFRAPNGVCLNPDGTFFMTDQEGHWTPKNRINLVVKGGFYGNMFGYHDVSDPSDAAMSQPLCWITNVFDRSPAQVVRVTDPRWGPLNGSLLSLSYGYGKVFVVPHETVDGQIQGGVCELPIPAFPTGVVRGRFHPGNGHLYLAGLYGWAGSRTEPGGFYRLRATGKPAYLPVGLHARTKGMAITFTDPLDPKTATDPSRYAVRTWSLKRTANYGSPHHDETPSRVSGVTLSADRRTVVLEIPGVRPTMSMQIVYAIQGAGGEPVEGRIHNTIHKLGDDSTEARR